MISAVLFAAGLLLGQVDDMSTRLQRSAPRYLDKAEAVEHVFAVLQVADRKVSAELLLGMAYVESRYTPTSISRVEGGRRKTGVPKWDRPGRGVRGPYFCGVTQAIAGKSYARCVELQNIHEAYRTTVKELHSWLRFCTVKRAAAWPEGGHKRLRCALAGYGGGIAATERASSTYPARVLARAARLRAHKRPAVGF